jgi:serine/threonine-protein kinase haspin
VWDTFNPHSNVVWLHYLADKLLKAMRYPRNTREDQVVCRQFRQLVKEALEYESAFGLVLDSPFVNS